MKPSTFMGLRSAIYAVTDLDRAKAWYRSLLGVEPYFDEPFYVGFNVRGLELGLHPAEAAQQPGAGGAVPYWGVESMPRAWARLLKLEARPVSPPQDVGGGIQVAVASDPFGNPIGVIENPHFPNTA